MDPEFNACKLLQYIMYTYPKPNYNYEQSMKANFIKVEEILKNPNLLKYMDEKDVKILKELDEKLKQESTNKLYDA